MLNTLLLILASLGCWKTIPLDKHVQSRPLIIQATVIAIDRAPPIPRQETADPEIVAEPLRYDRATLRLDAVLKTSDATISAPGTIVLIMPAADRTVRMSTDLTYPLGAGGIWMLQRNEDGWRTTHPDDLQPLAQLDTIRRHIAEQAAIAHQ